MATSKFVKRTLAGESSTEQIEVSDRVVGRLNTIGSGTRPVSRWLCCVQKEQHQLNEHEFALYLSIQVKTYLSNL